jgi:hypothetical protein
MNPTLTQAIDLIRTAHFGVASTLAVDPPGHPYASLLPFVSDEQCRPIFLISGLAEHTRNLQQDARASFVVWQGGADDAATAARLTLVGEAQPFDADTLLTERYLRYQPDARQFLTLGDFRFFRLQPARMRYIAGFGEMGWIEGADLAQAPHLSLADEAELVAYLQVRLSPNVTLLGLDALGADLRVDDARRRLRFANPATERIAIETEIAAHLSPAE